MKKLLCYLFGHKDKVTVKKGKALFGDDLAIHECVRCKRKVYFGRGSMSLKTNPINKEEV